MLGFIIAVAAALVEFLPVEKLEKLVILVFLALLDVVCNKLLDQ